MLAFLASILSGPDVSSAPLSQAERAALCLGVTLVALSVLYLVVDLTQLGWAKRRLGKAVGPKAAADPSTPEAQAAGEPNKQVAEQYKQAKASYDAATQALEAATYRSTEALQAAGLLMGAGLVLILAAVISSS